MCAIPLGGVWLDLRAREVAGQRLDLALLRRQLEVHDGQTNGVRRGAILLAILALAGCGGHGGRSPENVARAWSAALDRNDNEAAARLFADDAKVVQGGELALRDHAAAVHWNAMLPCGRAILSVTTQSKTDVLVVFKLDERPKHRCDGPGARAAALFRVESGKIVLWHQTEAPPPREPGAFV